MNTIYRMAAKSILFGTLFSVSAQCSENLVQFGFNETWDSNGQKILVFYLNPSNWMFGISGGWAVDDSVKHFTWGCQNYAVEADFGEGWAPLRQKQNATGYNRIQLYYQSLHRFDSTVAFPASKLSDDILAACEQKGLDSCRLKIRYTLTAKVISSTHDKFESGPQLESDWILVEVRKKIVYLVGYWDSEVFRGYHSTSGRDISHEVRLDSPVALGP